MSIQGWDYSVQLHDAGKEPRAGITAKEEEDWAVSGCADIIFPVDGKQCPLFSSLAASEDGTNEAGPGRIFSAASDGCDIAARFGVRYSS